MRVLVVDDSPEVRARIVAMLREVEAIATIDEAASADEALTRARMHGPNVVILDINMPGRNGLVVLPALRSLPSAPLVIVLTNDPTDHHRRQSLANGAHFFFDKSKHFDGVLDVLQRRAPTRAG
ncbi:MAG: response regulator transcription factor [Polyangiales bacterium]